MFLTSAMLSLSNLWKLPSTAERQLRSHRLNFNDMHDILGILIDPSGCLVITSDVFTSVTCRSSDLFGKRRRKSMATALPSAMEHHSWSRRWKFRITAPYLRNFDRHLGLPGHWRRCLTLTGNMSFERSFQKTMAWVHGNCHYHQT